MAKKNKSQASLSLPSRLSIFGIVIIFVISEFALTAEFGANVMVWKAGAFGFIVLVVFLAFVWITVARIWRNIEKSDGR